MNLHDKYLKAHNTPTNFIFDRGNLQIYANYQSGIGWFLDISLDNNVNDNTIKISIEAGNNLESGIRMLIENLIEKLAWEENE